jgi:tRNA(fMet)-specific endonuclease VapC
VKYVLDTSTLLALLKGRSVVVTRLDIAGKLAVSVPQPVWAEVTYGIERLPRSKRKESLQARFKLLRDELARSSWTDEVSDHFGAVKASLERRGLSIEDQDIVVAAHALAAGAVLVTSETASMSRVEGLEVEDWEGEDSSSEA